MCVSWSWRAWKSLPAVLLLSVAGACKRPGTSAIAAVETEKRQVLEKAMGPLENMLKSFPEVRSGMASESAAMGRAGSEDEAVALLERFYRLVYAGNAFASDDEAIRAYDRARRRMFKWVPFRTAAASIGINLPLPHGLEVREALRIAVLRSPRLQKITLLNDWARDRAPERTRPLVIALDALGSVGGGGQLTIDLYFFAGMSRGEKPEDMGSTFWGIGVGTGSGSVSRGVEVSFENGVQSTYQALNLSAGPVSGFYLWNNAGWERIGVGLSAPVVQGGEFSVNASITGAFDFRTFENWKSYLVPGESENLLAREQALHCDPSLFMEEMLVPERRRHLRELLKNSPVVAPARGLRGWSNSQGRSVCVREEPPAGFRVCHLRGDLLACILNSDRSCSDLLLASCGAPAAMPASSSPVHSGSAPANAAFPLLPSLQKTTDPESAKRELGCLVHLVMPKVNMTEDERRVLAQAWRGCAYYVHWRGWSSGVTVAAGLSEQHLYGLVQACLSAQVAAFQRSAGRAPDLAQTNRYTASCVTSVYELMVQRWMVDGWACVKSGGGWACRESCIIDGISWCTRNPGPCETRKRACGG